MSVLFVHQGYELYGSDRTLIQSVDATAARWPDAKITVLLPRQGSLSESLRRIVPDVRICDLAILRKCDLKNLRPHHLGSLIRNVLKARSMMKEYDVTYINTVAVMDFILAACLLRRPRIIHVHEIPTGPPVLLFSTLLLFSRAFLIFNSFATRRRFPVPFWQRHAVVWNGAPARPLNLTDAPRSTLNLLLIGRFNAWKGQSILLRAVARLPTTLRARVCVRLLGGVFGTQTHFADELKQAIRDLNLSDQVEMLPFAPDPSAHYAWADAVVVPSTKPEPFGLVAIEAMAAGCAVIASNHGGLAEIVVDGVTGTFVTPGSVQSLSAAIAAYLEEPPRIAREGRAGRERFTLEFEEGHYKEKIAGILADLLERAAGSVAGIAASQMQRGLGS